MAPQVRITIPLLLASQNRPTSSTADSLTQETVRSLLVGFRTLCASSGAKRVKLYPRVNCYGGTVCASLLACVLLLGLPPHPSLADEVPPAPPIGIRPADGPPSTHDSEAIAKKGQFGSPSQAIIFPSPIAKAPAQLFPDKLDVLPKAKTAFPSHDGDGFLIRLATEKVGHITKKQAYEKTISKVVAALGCKSPCQVGIPTKSGLRAYDAGKDIKAEGIEQSRPDLRALARLICRDQPIVPKASEGELCAALISLQRAGPKRDNIIFKGRESDDTTADRVGKWLNNRIGMDLRQFVNDMERQEIEYFFPQIHIDRKKHGKFHAPAAIPVEHSGILASRWEGQSIGSISGRVVTDYQIANVPKLSKKEAKRLAPLRIQNVSGFCGPKATPLRVELLLLPTGSKNGKSTLLYAYRMPMEMCHIEGRALIYLWLDAETGDILELQTLGGRQDQELPHKATGITFARSPLNLPTIVSESFFVDPPQNRKYGLTRNRVLQLGSFYYDGSIETINHPPVVVPYDSNAPPHANFSLDRITKTNDAENTTVTPQAMVACHGKGDRNYEFQYVDLFATLSRYHAMAINAGVYQPFPTRTMQVAFNGSCEASGTTLELTFGFCVTGYMDTDMAFCPNVPDTLLPTLHDHTIVAHEFGHALTPRQLTDRPPDWCVGSTMTGTYPCPVPNSAALFHDFADAWAHAFENTNCLAGWSAKNLGGKDNSLECKAGNHSEGAGLPRLSFVSWPTASEQKTLGDHFPEHRDHFKDPYADMQIASAALWAIRQGMMSLDPIAGSLLYFERLVHTIRRFGWLGAQPTGQTASDAEIYQGLIELETRLAEQWVKSGQGNGVGTSQHRGSQTINKVFSGFAKAGIFMIPLACIDSDPATAEPQQCRQGENGADAVIDVDDNDPTDDQPSPQWDYLRRNPKTGETQEPLPKFHVWTGPRYKFSRDGSASGFKPSSQNPAPCNTQYQVELATNEAFSENLVVSTLENNPWRTVSASDESACYGVWSPEPAAWTKVKGEAGETKIYYRVRTLDKDGKNERVSTSPAQGLFNGSLLELPPPYAIVNDTGQRT